eukprot:c9455_g1_i1.p1 GENE.c9455_g1_i1~~c9455_g1_i1.p1  ORF type:complete len:828 (-),score=180.10 c9455_g1_i1:110-2593(-)
MWSCPLCGSGADSSKHCPRVISCGHIYCTKCLEELCGITYSIECPQDQRVTPVSDREGGVAGLPTAYSFSQQHSDPDPIEVSSICEACTVDHTATHYCADCSKTLCSKAAEEHKTLPDTSEHIVQSVDQMCGEIERLVLEAQAAVPSLRTVKDVAAGARAKLSEEADEAKGKITAFFDQIREWANKNQAALLKQIDEAKHSLQDREQCVANLLQCGEDTTLIQKRTLNTTSISSVVAAKHQTQLATRFVLGVGGDYGRLDWRGVDEFEKVRRCVDWLANANVPSSDFNDDVTFENNAKSRQIIKTEATATRPTPTTTTTETVATIATTAGAAAAVARTARAAASATEPTTPTATPSIPISSTPKHRVVDPQFPRASTAKIVSDYDAVLNQTNIGGNNNKYYILQILEADGSYWVWRRWGRVGENGQYYLETYEKLEQAIKAFEQKFKEKTKNSWADRENFVQHPGKYTMLDRDTFPNSPTPTLASDVSSQTATLKTSSLDPATQELMNTIFETSVFTEALSATSVDVMKMPLSVPKMTHVTRCYEILQRIEAEIGSPQPSRPLLLELSSQFYTIIPHTFGRRVPPVLDSMALVDSKFKLLETLSESIDAQSLLLKAAENPPLDADAKYAVLQNQMNVVEKASHTFQVISECVGMSAAEGATVLDVWELNREGEAERTPSETALVNRRLLWHSASCISLAATLAHGFKVTPHSRGEAGRGIYHTARLDVPANGQGNTAQFAFLNEVLLGNSLRINRHDPSLSTPPDGYDSIHAVGRQSDPFSCTLVGGELTVTQGTPPAEAQSEFAASEYVVFQESQVRMRFLVKFRV